MAKKSFDEIYMNLASDLASRSHCVRAQVGAVLTKDTRIISIGYNGFPMGVEDSAERLQDTTLKLELVVHAEVNALIAAGSRSSGSTLYVWGKPICARCAGPVIQSGVKRIVAPSPESVANTSKWHKTGEYAYEMFKEAGIQVDFYSVSDAPSV